MSDQSLVKSEIVSKYFGAWSIIMASKARTGKLAYIDLFAGPGRYNDNSKSTPIKVLETIVNNPKLVNRMVTIFNDANPDYAQNLKSEIFSMPNIEKLQYQPTIINTIIGNEIAEMFEKTNMVPTLAFIDPWGYKGLSSKLIAALIKDWGSDAIFFFNYNRINMGIKNPSVIPHMNSIFGEERTKELQNKVTNMSPYERELTILNELAESLSFEKQNYVLPFRFIKKGERTSHYLIFISKHVLGYTIMKNIMYDYSSEHEDGVASFSYISNPYKQLSLLSLYSRKLDTLGEELLKIFSGETLSVKEIHDCHQINTPFVFRNYQEALRRLEAENKIICNPAKRKYRNGIKTMGEKVSISFPKLSN